MQACGNPKVNNGEKVEGEWLDITTKGKIRILLKVELVQTKRKYIFTINKLWNFLLLAPVEAESIGGHKEIGQIYGRSFSFKASLFK